MKTVTLLLGFPLVIFLMVGCSSNPEQLDPIVPTATLPAANDKNLTLDSEKIIIARIIDGDTIEVQLPTGLKDTVRLMGVDTPETSKSNRSDEYEGITDIACLDMWGTKATEFTKNYLLGGIQNHRLVVLESDSLTGERGHYNRLLAYVIVDDIDFNGVLIKNGYARVYIEEPFSKASEYLSLQKSARDKNLGLWSCKTKPQDKSTTDTASTPTPPVSSQNSTISECDDSYPNVCIPPYPPDLDCGEVPYRRFVVLPPDRHRFDGDGDGLGCES